MTVGEALAEARTRAGLSVDEVSERTKIREMVIRGIERDDYEACGGDLFVRGYVRVIASAVGLDAQPLIREYDQSHRLGSPIAPVRPAPEPEGPPADHGTFPADEPQAAADERQGPPEPEPELAAEPEPEPEPELAAEPEPEPELAPEPANAAGPEPEPAAGAELVPVPRPGYELVPLRIQPGPRLHPSLTERTWRRWLRDRRWSLVAAVLALAVLAVAAAAVEHVTANAGGGSGRSTSSASATSAHSGVARQAPPQAAAADANRDRAAGPGTGAVSRPGRVTALRPGPVGRLAVPLAEAFGPDGIADGDNPGSAMNAVRARAPGPWTTQWYASARFGMLKPGTGLLLDLGRAATVTRVVVDLGAGSGADLQLRAGKAPGGLRAEASAAGAGNVVLRLRRPARARYLLVWFTTLPATGNGQYQAKVYHVTVDGRP